MPIADDETLAGNGLTDADRLVAEVFTIAGCYKGTEEAARLARALMDIFDFQDEEPGAYLALNDAAYVRSDHYCEAQNRFRAPASEDLLASLAA
ncbi:MAG: hypothetical protein MOB07_16365 [Acidobacteria bacterium]|nr:hypothetical protein [Acidobacteriota bacterium]